MKRILRIVLSMLVMLIAVSSIGTAAAKDRRIGPPQEEPEFKVVPAPATLAHPAKPERKSRGSATKDDGAVLMPSASKPVALPIGISMKRAGSVKLDLRSLPQTPLEKKERPERPEPAINRTAIQGSAPPQVTAPSVPVQSAPAPATIANFDGLDFANWGDGHPPDTNGDVGPTYYVQSINTSIGIYNKATGVRVTAFSFNTFMSQGHFGNLCDTSNFGDPVVLYDTFEDRWIITDFAFSLDNSGNILNPPGSFHCFAVSMTGDPVNGGWHFYSINTAGGIGDYPKFGIWPDGLYMSVNMFDYAVTGDFQSPRVYALNKAQMYAGKPSVQVVTFNAPIDDFTLLPGNARLQTGTPPPGTPNYFVSTWELLNALTVYKLHVDWTRPTASTFTGPDAPVAATSWPNAEVPNAPSLGGNSQGLDVIEIRAMMQNQYSNIGGAESLWTTHTVRRADTSGFAAPRWYQVNVTGGAVAPNLPQATTWDPDGANVKYRFVPSLAVDRAGDLALGYSMSSSATKPSIMYAGRLAADPLNTFSQSEQLLIQGAGTQVGPCGGQCTRWGDYSAMSVDPDGCTFWFTSMYYAANGLNHKTRIGSFAYPSCTPTGAGGTLSGTVIATVGGAPIGGVAVTLGSRTTTTNGSGFYSFPTLPAGTYPVITATYPGYNPATATAIVVTDGNTTTHGFSLDLAATSGCPTDTTTSDFQAGDPLTNVDLTTSPGDVLLSNGFTSGTYVSGLKDANPASGLSTIWSTLSWTANTPANTSLKFQVAGSNSDLGPFNFIGPDGTAATFYTTTGASLSQFYGLRYLKYTAYLATTNSGVSPALHDVTICYSVANCTGATAPITPTPAQVCAGSAGNTASGPAGATAYAWTINNGTITGGASAQIVTYTAGASGIVGLGLSVTTAAGCPVSNSMNVPIVVVTAPTITPGGPTTFCAGGSVTLSSSSASANQWFLDGNPIGGATGQQYIATASGNYIVTVTISGCSASSAATTVTVNPPTPIITPGGPTTFCTGGSVTLTSSGATGNQWSLNGNPIGGATAPQFIANASGSYTVTVTTGGCTSVPSAATTVTVNPIPVTPTVTPGGPTTFCAGGSVTLTSSSATGNQWSLGGTPIAGATSQTYIATASGNYTVTVTATGCMSAPSAAATVTVIPLPSTPTITAGGSTTFCTGGSVTLTSSSATGNQWYLAGSAIGGATSQGYIATAAGDYTVVVTAGACSSSPSATTTVTINAFPVVPTITPSGPTTFCAGGSVTLTSSSNGDNQWYLNGNPIGAISQTLDVTASGDYSVVVTASACSSSPSAVTTVNVLPLPPTPTITPGGPTTFCAGGSVTLTSSSASGNQWYLNGNPIGGATNQPYVATASGNYTVTVTGGGCTSIASATTTVTVNPIPATPTITPGGPTTFCAGGGVTLTSSSASGNQWDLDGSPIAGATNQAYIASATGNYTVAVTTPACNSAPSAPVSVTVNPIPATPTITGGPTSFCAGGSVMLTSSSTTGNQWFSNGTPISGAAGQTYVAAVAADYTVKVTTSGCTSAPSAATTVTVHPLPNATITSPASMVTATSAGASVASAGGGATYVWGITNGSITAGAGTASITFTAGAIGTTTLNVTVTTSSGCSDAKTASITVKSAAPDPTIATVVPSAGRITGGVPITINGTGFQSGATVTIGGSATTSVVFVSSVKLTARTPAHAAGLVSVTINNLDTTTTTSNNAFTYVAQQFDANGDGAIDPSDIFYLVNFLFTHGPTPRGAAGTLSGDANGDGTVDPADIFYIVNFLFTHGPAPFAISVPQRTATSAGQALRGALSLGPPMTRDARTYVPVILTMAPGSPTPQAIALRLLFHQVVRDARIHRAGAAANAVTSFEISRPADTELSYLVAFDQISGGLLLGTNGANSAVIAEVELAGANASEIEFDPDVTILSDASGMHTAKVSNGTLQISGVDGTPGPGMKRPGINQ